MLRLSARATLLLFFFWLPFNAVAAGAALIPSGAATDDDLGLPALVYDYFRAAEEAARQGDAAAFREAVAAAGGNYAVSPDGRKALVGTGDRFDEYWEADMWEEPVFYFELGRGLLRYGIKRASFHNAAWSAEARYCAFSATTEGQPASLYVTDTEAGEDVALGHLGWRESGASFVFEGRYLVWLSYEERPGGPEAPPLWIPGLRAYDVEAGKTVELLKADMATFENYPGSQFGGRVKLVPAAGVPQELKTANLYNEYNGVYIDCRVFGM
ncbi:MAG: hypothetical protein JSU81_04720 [Candidatus Coatesbacteria bacterium]|nr:MAG: hypothetical protein JSU81_04720 [Candidatus Coatesbacteria bacterium]